MKFSTAALAFLMAAGCAANIGAQEEVIQQKQVKLHHLIGEVVDPRGFPVEYAVVELRDGSSHRVLASTFADAQGRFSFADRKRGAQLEIRATQKGFNPAIYEIVIREMGKSKIRIVLFVAA